MANDDYVPPSDLLDGGIRERPAMASEPISDERLAEIRARLVNWQRGYWLAGEKNASLMRNGEERREIAVISAEHSTTIDLLTHAYADIQELLAEVTRLRAREAALVEIAVGAARLDQRVGIECGCRLVMALGHYDDCWVMKAHIAAHTLPSGEVE